MLTYEQRSVSTRDCGQRKNGQYLLAEGRGDQYLAPAILATRLSPILLLLGHGRLD